MSALDDIRQRAEAATEGPWRLWRDRSPHDLDNNRGAAVESAWAYDADGEDTELITDWCRTADAEFVAHARTDIPRLLGALDAVEKVRKELFDLSNDEGLTIDRRATYRDASRAIYTAVNDALEAGK